MIKGCIFDLDGTLLDTLASLANSFNRTLTRLGYPVHPVDSYRYFIGDGLRKCVERCLPPRSLTDDNIDAMMDAQQADYEQSWHLDTAPYEGMTALLRQLLADDIPLAVLSNKNHPFTVRCVDHFFPGIPFASVIGHSAAVPHKPDPTGALAAARAMAVRPAEVAVIGDTATDMRTAGAAGMAGIGALWGFRDRDELKNAGAKHIISHPSELGAILREQRDKREEEQRP